MLKKLRIKNVVLIEDAELDFCGGLNILSGETGAGKSILIDAVQLLMGGRYDKNLLRFGAASGLVEGLFYLNPYSVSALKNLGIGDDGEEEALVSRKFYADGKNEIRINGRAVTASILKEFCCNLIDIYGQHDYRYYTDNKVQLEVLDGYVRHNLSDLSKKCIEQYQNYKVIIKKIRELGDGAEREKNIDFLKYQIAEIEEAKVKHNEEDELVETRRLALNAEKISELIRHTLQNLKETSLNSAFASLKKLEGYGDSFAGLSGRLQSVIIETDDVCDTLKTAESTFDFDQTRLDKIEERLFIVRAIKRKYGEYDKCAEFLANAKQRLEFLQNGSEMYDKLMSDKTKAVRDLYNTAVQMSAVRNKGGLELAAQFEKELSQLGMERARFKVEFSELPPVEACEKALTAGGLDNIEFLFSANAGQPLQPFGKIASGGEMSRFMLALKVIMSAGRMTADSCADAGDSDIIKQNSTGHESYIPTLIFDEIDSGISGKVGQEVAKKLARIALFHQVLCVTHLPQIASMADAHFFIDKSSGVALDAIDDNSENKADETTRTTITPLELDGMVREISRLSGGIGISGASETSAREMKKWSQDYKRSLGE